VPEKFDAAINLAGENVNRRWTARAKKAMRDSRVDTTAALRAAAERAGAHTFVAGSAVGFYGETGQQIADEDSPPGDDFLARVCVEWEAAAKSESLRVVNVRTGFVLGPDAEGLKMMAQPFRWFVGGVVAGGGQYMPWVHVDDVLAMFQWALENKEVSGPVNAVAPAPATNREVSKSLARALHRPCWLPVPGFAVKLALGEMGELALQSQRVMPNRAMKLGFEFKHADLDEALRESV
jgi:uncharacterized protein (TIGR01777 family)